MLGRTTATSDGAGQKRVFLGYPWDVQHYWESGCWRGERTSRPAARAWEGCSPFRWRAPGRCAQRGSALRVTGSSAAGSGVRTQPPPSLVRQGRHAAIQQQRLRPGCALRRGDAAIVWHASGAWWDVRLDSWYCCETGMLLVVLGWQKHLGAAGRGMGQVPRLLCGVAPLAGLPRLRGIPAQVGTEAGLSRWPLASSTSHRSTWQSCDGAL